MLRSFVNRDPAEFFLEVLGAALLRRPRSCGAADVTPGAPPPGTAPGTGTRTYTPKAEAQPQARAETHKQTQRRQRPNHKHRHRQKPMQQEKQLEWKRMNRMKEWGILAQGSRAC